MAPFKNNPNESGGMITIRIPFGSQIPLTTKQGQERALGMTWDMAPLKNNPNESSGMISIHIPCGSQIPATTRQGQLLGSQNYKKQKQS